MAKSSSYQFSNTTASTHPVTPKVLGVTTNYALQGDAADVVTLNNKTAPIDAEEVIQYRSRTLEKPNWLVPVLNPPKVMRTIEYSTRIDAILTTTDSSDASFRVDEPITCSISIRHPKSGNFTNALVAEMFVRSISTLLRSDGTWRFDDLMRSAERPIVD